MINELAYKEFITYLTEREAIRLRKESGEPAHWTKDPILQAGHFCNVFIEDDFGSRYIQEAMKRAVSIKTKLERLVIFRLVNNPKFFEACGWPDQGLEEHLKKAKEYLKTNSLRRQAYLCRFSKGFGSTHPEIYENVAPRIIPEIERVAIALYRASTRHDAWLLLKSIKHGIGEFIAFVIIEDLRMIDMAWWPDDWCHVGPGAKDFLRFLCGPGYDVPRLTELRDRVNKDLKLKRPFDLMDIEHNLCEVRKALSIRDNGKIRRRYSTFKNT